MSFFELSSFKKLVIAYLRSQEHLRDSLPWKDSDAVFMITTIDDCPNEWKVIYWSGGEEFTRKVDLEDLLGFLWERSLPKSE